MPVEGATLAAAVERADIGLAVRLIGSGTHAAPAMAIRGRMIIVWATDSALEQIKVSLSEILFLLYTLVHDLILVDMPPGM